MGGQILQMRYHPAKKEVEFRRFQGTQEIPIRSDSKLQKYMQNEKGTFVLQDHGRELFDDIAANFDGLPEVAMRVITTKPDFIDFQQMAEYYNAAPDRSCHITAEPGSALSDEEDYLPDMGQIYRNVSDYGQEAVQILEAMQRSFAKIPAKNADVKKSVDIFSEEVSREIDSIRTKVESLGDNNVNLCFAGVYSSGKSALINALLGYRILPEYIQSKTARMFRIKSPRKNTGEAISIQFMIGAEGARLVWSEDARTFYFEFGPSENTSVANINRRLAEIQTLPQHQQIYQLLDLINGDPDICADIQIVYPIPLDTEAVQFTILDTPGTDSDSEAHQSTLRKALMEQKSSILVFVAAPNKMEGTGNHKLLSFIKEVEENHNSTIDISRSLFVINFSDSIGPKDRDVLQSAEIRYRKADDEEDDGNGFSIRLSDKKLFFTSAKYAYVAEAAKRGIATDEDKRDLRKAKLITDPDDDSEQYFRQNRCANSEFATAQMLDQCGQALENAREAGDELEIIHICSGLYALKTEILQYGEKYAAAVRAFAIIDSVDKAIASMYHTMNSLGQKNQEELQRLIEEIDSLREAILGRIHKAINTRDIPAGKKLPHKTLTDLGLDKERCAQISGDVEGFVQKKLKSGLWGLGRPKATKERKKKIEAGISAILNEWSESFLARRADLLEDLRGSVIKEIQKAIYAEDRLSKDIKAFICDIRQPEIADSDVSAFGYSFDQSKYSDYFLWIRQDYIHKKDFLERTGKELQRILVKVTDDCSADYTKALRDILQKIDAEFTKNLENYSILLKAKQSDKAAAEQLQTHIQSAVDRLTECQEELDHVIWGGR